MKPRIDPWRSLACIPHKGNPALVACVSLCCTWLSVPSSHTDGRKVGRATCSGVYLTSGSTNKRKLATCTDIHATNVELNFVTKIKIKCQNRINVIPILLEIIFREVKITKLVSHIKVWLLWIELNTRKITTTDNAVVKLALQSILNSIRVDLVKIFYSDFLLFRRFYIYNEYTLQKNLKMSFFNKFNEGILM